jgi:hypothetical protein
MPELGGDDDEIIEVGSDYPYKVDLKSGNKNLYK